MTGTNRHVVSIYQQYINERQNRYTLDRCAREIVQMEQEIKEGLMPCVCKPTQTQVIFRGGPPLQCPISCNKTIVQPVYRPVAIFQPLLRGHVAWLPQWPRPWVNRATHWRSCHIWHFYKYISICNPTVAPIEP